MSDKAQERIRVLLADDHAILREGLTSLMEKQPDIAVVGEAEDGKECLEKAAALLPDVVVLDISFRDVGDRGLPAAQVVHPLIRVIMLSMYEDYEYIDKSLHAGADGYLLKKVASSELVSAVRRAGQGEKVFSPQVRDAIVASMRQERPEAGEPSPVEALTAREKDVLSLMSEGLSNKQIAATLYLSPKTVEKIVSGIYRKLNVSSRTAAVKLFLSD